MLLTIIRGVPGTGKTTLANAISNHEANSKDAYICKNL